MLLLVRLSCGGEWLFAVGRGRCRRGLCVLGTGDTVKEQASVWGRSLLAEAAELLQSKVPLPAFPYSLCTSRPAPSRSLIKAAAMRVWDVTLKVVCGNVTLKVVVCGIVTLKLLAQQCGTN